MLAPCQPGASVRMLKLETPWDDDEDEDAPHRHEEDDDTVPDEDDPGEDDDQDDEEPLRAWTSTDPYPLATVPRLPRP